MDSPVAEPCRGKSGKQKQVPSIIVCSDGDETPPTAGSSIPRTVARPRYGRAAGDSRVPGSRHGAREHAAHRPRRVAFASRCVSFRTLVPSAQRQEVQLPGHGRSFLDGGYHATCTFCSSCCSRRDNADVHSNRERITSRSHRLSNSLPHRPSRHRIRATPVRVIASA